MATSPSLLQEQASGQFAGGSLVWPDVARDNPGTYLVQERVIQEVEELCSDKGMEALLVTVDDPDSAPGDPDAAAVIEVANQLEIAQVDAQLRCPQEPNRVPTSGYNRFRDYRYFPAIAAGWSKHLMEALALHTLYGAGRLQTLGGGISPDAYDRPLFNVTNATEASGPMSAREVEARRVQKNELPADAAQRASQKVVGYQEFIAEPIDDNSRQFFLHAPDSRAIRSRAAVFANEAIASQRDPETGALPRQVRIASMACGAAGPVFGLQERLRAEGSEIAQAVLIDSDPMALATAYSLAEAQGLDGAVDLQLRDLIHTNAADYVAEKVDIVDALGLFEYFPDRGLRSRFSATNLLVQAASITKPGGSIIIGNMLKDRPQQRFFNEVVSWPRLQQRDINAVLKIVADAGLNPDAVKVRVCADEGIYAVYSIPVPEGWVAPGEALGAAA